MRRRGGRGLRPHRPGVAGNPYRCSTPLQERETEYPHLESACLLPLSQPSVGALEDLIISDAFQGCLTASARGTATARLSTGRGAHANGRFFKKHAHVFVDTEENKLESRAKKKREGRWLVLFFEFFQTARASPPVFHYPRRALPGDPTLQLYCIAFAFEKCSLRMPWRKETHFEKARRRKNETYFDRGVAKKKRSREKGRENEGQRRAELVREYSPNTANCIASPISRYALRFATLRFATKSGCDA